MPLAAPIAHAFAPLADKARLTRSVTANTPYASCAVPSPEARQFSPAQSVLESMAAARARRSLSADDVARFLAWSVS